MSEVADDEEIALLKDLYSNPANVGRLGNVILRLIARVEQVKHERDFVSGDFVRGKKNEIELGQHFADAMMALTSRKAYSKAEVAILIAEQADLLASAKEDIKRWEAFVSQRTKPFQSGMNEVTCSFCNRTTQFGQVYQHFSSCIAFGVQDIIKARTGG